MSLSGALNAELPGLPASPRVDTEFQKWWLLPGEWVEAPNERREGISGVSYCVLPASPEAKETRIYLKRQRGHVFRNWRHPVSGLPTAAREAHFLQRLQTLGLAVPTTTYFAYRSLPGHQYAILATEELAGFRSLEQFYADPADRKQFDTVDALVRQALANYLARMHAARLQHGCLYPKHVFVRLNQEPTGPSAEVALIDLEKMRIRMSSRKASARDLAQFQRHQQFWTGQAWDHFTQLYHQAFEPQSRMFGTADRRALPRAAE